jgi:hypothetical protein
MTVSELQTSFSLKFKPRTLLWGYDYCACNVLAETSNIGFGAVVLSCLVPALQEPSLPGLKLWATFELSDISSFFKA